MADHGENSGGVLHRWELAAEIEKSKLAAVRKDVERAKEELVKINKERKENKKRPLSLEEYLAIKFPAPVIRPLSMSSYGAKTKVRPPIKMRESYIELVKAFMNALDTGSEIEIIERSKAVFFHYFSLDEFKSVIDKASARFLLSFLISMMNRLDDEVSRFIMENDESSKTAAFRDYLNKKQKEAFAAKKIHDEEVEAAARAAALKAEADAVEAARLAEEARVAEVAATKAAAAEASERKALNVYRKTIEEYAGAQNKAGRAGNAAARGRSMLLRAALNEYNRTGKPVPETLLTKKIKKNLTEKGVMKGGLRRRSTRRHRD
jgi:hypothetical protein